MMTNNVFIDKILEDMDLSIYDSFGRTIKLEFDNNDKTFISKYIVPEFYKKERNKTGKNKKKKKIAKKLGLISFPKFLKERERVRNKNRNQI